MSKFSEFQKKEISKRFKGVPKSEEHKKKISESHKMQVECPHCGKKGGKRIMHRWHFKNCKHKEE